MKMYRITTQVQVTKTIQYIVEAETGEEAQQQIVEGKRRGRGSRRKSRLVVGNSE